MLCRWFATNYVAVHSVVAFRLQIQQLIHFKQCSHVVTLEANAFRGSLGNATEFGFKAMWTHWH